ncbi:hypothetical protein [Actinomadura formosensis]|uniref:hypothetical protein n=1 Tax=Actinomadura formosensis TaxID=60706 RepID=UPI003D8F52C1
MALEFAVKLAAFCKELNGRLLEELARNNSMVDVYESLREAVRAERAGDEAEAWLDQLNDLVRRELGRGFYPDSRNFRPLNGGAQSSGARWWHCPAGLCAGYGRVLPGQSAPICGALGAALVAGPPGL